MKQRAPCLSGEKLLIVIQTLEKVKAKMAKV